MENILKNASFDFACPTCKHSLKISLDSVGTNIHCPFCNQGINLKDEGFSDGLAQINHSINDLKKVLKKI